MTSWIVFKKEIQFKALSQWIKLRIYILAKNDRNNVTGEGWKTGNIMLDKLLNGWIQNHLTRACRWRGWCVFKFITLLKFKLSFTKLCENIANKSWAGIQDAVSIWSKTVVIPAKIYLKEFFEIKKKNKQFQDFLVTEEYICV